MCQDLRWMLVLQWQKARSLIMQTRYSNAIHVWCQYISVRAQDTEHEISPEWLTWYDGEGSTLNWSLRNQQKWLWYCKLEILCHPVGMWCWLHVITWPWPVWLSWLEHHPITKRLPVWFLVREHPGLWVRSPVWARMGGNQSTFLPHIDISLSLSSSLPSSLSKEQWKKCPQVKIIK